LISRFSLLRTAAEFDGHNRTAVAKDRDHERVGGGRSHFAVRYIAVPGEGAQKGHNELFSIWEVSLIEKIGSVHWTISATGSSAPQLDMKIAASDRRAERHRIDAHRPVRGTEGDATSVEDPADAVRDREADCESEDDQPKRFTPHQSRTGESARPRQHRRHVVGYARISK
jgi:hypothetical protein